VMMPEMDGNELCRRVKDDERTLHIPVVLLTAKAGLADKIDGLKMGADQFLAKPFNPKELLAIVESLLVQRELQAKLSKTLQELKETQVQLVHSDRLETVGQLAAGIAHEMKNKMYCVRAGLDGISKRLEMLHDGKITLEDTYDGLATALDTNEKALKDSLAIVNSLLSFSRKNREGWHFAELNKGIEDTVTMVLPMVKDKIGIRLELADLPLVECSIEEINQVLMNLIINAYQAMTRPGEVNISSAQKDNYVFVIVKDNGPGIPEENIDKIFTPFYSTKPEGKNSGLGLSICYNIVIAHHGSIEVASESDKGTTFTITLPIKQPIITDTSNK
ncbi:MAG: response regulator, partial [Desulfobulbaceae bacterium]|nr:response regulator [Desulfobulbaceae bacterium]